MLFVSFVRWWYGLGWLDQVALVRQRLGQTADFFSIRLSLRTLFSPFKQIDANRTKKGSLDMVLKASFDQLFSRFIGVIVRSILILVGCVAVVAEAIVGGLRLLIWPLMPLMPVIMVPVATTGWMPWR